MKQHYQKNNVIYFFILLSIVIGLIIGLYLSLTGSTYSSLLRSSDKNMFAYINGIAKYNSIFYSRLKDMLLCLAVLFLFNLTIYTCFLNFIYIAYQSALLVLSASAVISMYGLAGVVNVLLLILPINIVSLFVLSLGSGFGIQRAKMQWDYKCKFGDSFTQTRFFVKYSLCALSLLLLCLINSFLLPLVIKSIVIVSF